MPTQQDLQPGREDHKKGRKNRTDLCLSVYYNKKMDELSVKIIDKESLEVKKEIPALELEDIKGDIDELAGLMLNKKRYK